LKISVKKPSNYFEQDVTAEVDDDHSGYIRTSEDFPLDPTKAVDPEGDGVIDDVVKDWKKQQSPTSFVEPTLTHEFDDSSNTFRVVIKSPSSNVRDNSPEQVWIFAYTPENKKVFERLSAPESSPGIFETSVNLGALGFSQTEKDDVRFATFYYVNDNVKPQWAISQPITKIINSVRTCIIFTPLIACRL